MPLFFSKRMLSRTSGRPDPKPAPSPQHLAPDTAQRSDSGNTTAAPLVFPRYLDGRDICACVFSLPPVDGRWVEATLRQLRAPCRSASERIPQSQPAGIAPCDRRAKKRTRGGADSGGGFVAAGVATQSRRLNRCSSSAYTQRVMGNPPLSPIDDVENGSAAAASASACGLRLVWREASLDRPPSGSVSAATGGRMAENCHVASVGSRAEDQDVTAYPTLFRAFVMLDDDSGKTEAVTADVCGTAAGARSCASAEPRTPVAQRPRRAHVGDRDLIPGPDADSEPLADLTAPSCCTTTEVGETTQPPQATSDPCRRAAHWPRLCSLAIPKASSGAVGTISVSGSLPQRRFTEMESLWHFSFTAPSVPHALRMRPGARANARWSVTMQPTMWLGRKVEGDRDAEASARGVRPAAGAEIAASEAAIRAQLGGAAVTVPQLAVVRHARLRCLIRDNDSGGGGAEKEGHRTAPEVPPAASMTSTEDVLTAEALSAQWNAFVADVRESRMTQERRRAASTHERYLAAAASLSSVGENIAEALATLPQLHFSHLCTAASASHREGEEGARDALDVDPTDSMRGLGQAYPYPVLEWWRWTSCGRSRSPPSQHARKPPRRLPDTCVAFRSVPDDVEATRAQLVLTLRDWVRDMSDVRWRSASWLPWDAWITAVCAVAAVPLLLFPLSSRRAPLLMPSISRVQSRLRIAAAEEVSAASTAHLTADSLVLGGRPTGYSAKDRSLERQPWAALDAAPQLLREAMKSATARPGEGLLAAVAQEDAEDAKPLRCTMHTAAVAECEALARACERSARAPSQERERGAAAAATAAKESAAHTLHRPLLRRRRCDKLAAGGTSDDEHGRSEGRATARVGASPPDAASPNSQVAAFPSSPAVVYVARGHTDSAAVDLLGKHTRSPPATVLLLAPSESSPVSEASSAEGAGTGDRSVSEAVDRKRARSVATSPSAAQRCREGISAANDSPSLTASAATTEAGAVPSSSGNSLLASRPSSQSSSPPPSDALSVAHSCLHGDRFRRMRRWLMAPPSPTRLPLIPSRRRRRCTAVIHESASPTASTARAPVLQPPTRWWPCTRQALLQDAQSTESRRALVPPTVSVAPVHGERAEAGAIDDPAVCVNAALWPPAGEFATVAATGCSSRTTLRVQLPLNPRRGLGGATMRPVTVWMWAQLTLHNYAADALAGAILPGAHAIERQLAHQGQTPAIETAGARLLVTAEHWKQRRARRAVQRLALYGLMLAGEAPPPPSTRPQSRSTPQSVEGEETALSRGADHTAAGSFTVGAQLYRDELQRNDRAELAQCVRDALARAQYDACVRIFQRRSGHGEESAGKLAEARRLTDACGSAVSRTCASCKAAHDGSCTPMPALFLWPLSSWALPAPADGRCCVACERRLHRIIRDGMRRDGWLAFHTLWYDALSEQVSPYSPRTWPGCLLSATQGSATTHAASSEEDGTDASAHDAPLRSACAPQTRVEQRDIDSLDVGVDTESGASPLEVSAHEMRWYVDTSDEDDEWREAEEQDDGAVALHNEHSSSQWCCCCLASHENLIHAIMAQGEGLTATTEHSAAPAPTLERGATRHGGGAQPPLCPAWWRAGSTTGATTISDASSASQHNPTSAAARATARSQAVHRACGALVFGLLDAGGVSVSPPLSSWSLPSCFNTRTHGAAQEGTLDDGRAGSVSANSAVARLRRYAAQLLSCGALATRSAAVVTAVAATTLLCASSLRQLSPRSGMVAAATPAAQQQFEDEEDVEERVAPLRRCRHTRHVCSFEEEMQSLQTWLLPYWWARQQQHFAVTVKARQPPPRSRACRRLEHPLDGSHAIATTATHAGVDEDDDIGEDAHPSSLRCFLAPREESEAWVQLLHHAHLRQLRRPYGPLFHGRCLMRCAPFEGCIADAEVHHTYLAAMLRQRTEEACGALSAYPQWRTDTPAADCFLRYLTMPPQPLAQCQRSKQPSPTATETMITSEYKIVEKMATGSFGVVFKVRRVTDHQVFVMKRIPLLGLTAPQRRDAAQEIILMRDLHHPCVVSQRDAFLYNEHDLCLVMDYYDGGDMDTHMAAQRDLDMYFELDQVMLWFVQLVLGAQYLHAHNVVHRDIKIHNVFVRSKDMSVVLGDFGISERLGVDLANHTWVAAATMSGPHGSDGSSLTSVPAMVTTTAAGSPSPARMNRGDDAMRSLSISGGLRPSTPGGAGAGAPVLSPLLYQQTAWSSGQWGAGSQLCSPNSSPYQPLSHMRQTGASSNAASSCSLQRLLNGGVEAAMKGTPLYMAPEVLQGGAASPKSDVWSLGCVLYELLALRHPFESRDLAPLVMRVLRGQREPLPAHYPRPIADLINCMLCLDASQRPSCEEVLTVPCVRAYVDLWRSLRTPLDVPASPGESALMRQLQAWQANVAAWNARHPDDPRSKSVHYTELKRQLLSPACAPAEEREKVERRAVEAARTALLTAQPSGLTCSISSAAISGAIQGDGGVHDGTFFFGATGECLTGAAGRRSSELSSLPSAREGMNMGPSDSMRPYMVYDVAPEIAATAAAEGAGPFCAESAANKALNGRPPRPSRRPSGSPPPHPVQGEDLTVTGHNIGKGGARVGSLPQAANAARSEDSPMMSAAARKRRHLQARQLEPAAPQQGGESSRHDDTTEPERKPLTGVASPTIDGAAEAQSTTPPVPSSNFPLKPGLPTSPPLMHKRGATRCGSIDEDALFFQAYENVADMRFASLDEIAQSVVDLRQRVQQRMRHQRLLTDIEVLHERHGSALLRSMPHVLNVFEAAAAAEDGAEGPPGRSGGAQSTMSPEEAYARMVQQIDEQRSGHEQHQLDPDNAEKVVSILHLGQLPVGRPMPPRIRQLRESAALAQVAASEEARRRSRLLPRRSKDRSSSTTKRGVSFSAAVSMQFADPAAPLMASSTGGGRSSSLATAMELRRWRPYLERRNRLSAALTRVFDATTLRAVYSYYRTCALLQRDAAVVRRLVPDRQQWSALPSIEELAVLDRRLETGMSALRRDRHSSTFSVNGSGTVPSPCHPSGHRTPTAFQPAPVRIFTVAVSEVPGEQLQSSGTAPSVANPVASPLDLAGGAATKSRLPLRALLSVRQVLTASGAVTRRGGGSALSAAAGARSTPPAEDAEAGGSAADDLSAACTVAGGVDGELLAASVCTWFCGSGDALGGARDSRSADSPADAKEVGCADVAVTRTSTDAAPLGLAVTCPPALLPEVAAAVAAQPPVVSDFDAYTLSEAGLCIVALEIFMQGIGTELGALQPLRVWHALSQHHTHLPRPVAHFVAADPTSGGDFNERAQQAQDKTAAGAGGAVAAAAHEVQKGDALVGVAASPSTPLTLDGTHDVPRRSSFPCAPERLRRCLANLKICAELCFSFYLCRGRRAQRDSKVAVGFGYGSGVEQRAFGGGSGTLTEDFDGALAGCRPCNTLHPSCDAEDDLRGRAAWRFPSYAGSPAEEDDAAPLQRRMRRVWNNSGGGRSVAVGPNSWTLLAAPPAPRALRTSFGTLDGASVGRGLAPVDVRVRRKTLVAFCNVEVRYNETA
ncbi:Protein kinase domain family protein [Leishmania donovani]|uniref:Protein kinase domain family protein n=1 Tax=Leishmania donovani TaxID=5661 RepID=A0A504XUX0_LEIDO|nr:Protein kinase domain family protein [Leishmania donovani]